MGDEDLQLQLQQSGYWIIGHTIGHIGLSDTLLDALTHDIKSKWAIIHKKDQRMS